MNETVIKVEHLSKQYRIGQREGYKTFRETLVDAAKAPFVRLSGALSRERRAESNNGHSRPSAVGGQSSPDLIWALKDVSFEVKQGEVLGIIGRNGSGKSTLLKILSKITEPTEGRVELRGRVGSLLEVGTGFHPELTGHENIYLYGAILGMDRWEITRKFDEIVAFAELEKFIDTPVKRYSSGMYMRLAFAVAAHLEPEILLVDEVLAVGDAAFQKKCLGKMGAASKEGRTVLFVSHNMPAVLSLCPRAILLHSGQLLFNDFSKSVVQNYLEDLQSAATSVAVRNRQDRDGDGSVRVVDLCFETSSNPKGGYWVTGEDAQVRITYEGSEAREYRNIELAICIHKVDQSRLLYLGTKVVHQDIEMINGTSASFCSIPRLPLEPGMYSIHPEVKQNGIIADYVQAAAIVEVKEGDYYGTGVIWPYGGILCDYSWSHGSENRPS